MNRPSILFSRVTPELYERFHARVRAEGKTASEVIRKMAVGYLAGGPELRRNIRLVEQLQEGFSKASATFGMGAS